MTVKDVGQILEGLAPLKHAEDFDNVGLLVGNANAEVSGILVTLDTLENVVDEAIEKKCNLIVSFHPILFSGIKRLTGATYVERVLMKCITHNISIYCVHTALDNSPLGVNHKICEVLGLEDSEVLIPKKDTLKKITTYVPEAKADEVAQALFAVGAGAIGKYQDCSFRTSGTGTFTATEGASPAKGNVSKHHQEPETQLNMVYSFELESKIVKSLLDAHPYEEVAYELITLDNPQPYLGMGRVGNLPEPLPETSFLELLKEKFNLSVVRHSQFLEKPIHRVAVLGGSGAFAIGAAKATGADAFMTADLKYHQFFEAENQILLADVGHFESEQFTKQLLVDYLTKKIPNFAVSLAESITNPINYI
ncbi:MAG: Nif3-like dinuclear metal center hexameric protein [Bacteroidota bacterium]